MMRIEFEGMDEFLQQLEKLGNDVDKHADEALKNAGKVLQTEVKKRAPVRTGNLKQHIMLSEPKDRAIDVYVDGKAYYGAFLEEGTSKMRAQPFMYPAFQSSQFKIRREMVETLRRRMGLMP